MVSIRAARLAAAYTFAAFLLSGCAGMFQTPPFPPPVPPGQPVSVYHPIPDARPTCVERIALIEEGEASWYSLTKKMRKTASGEMLDPNGATAAHRYLPFGSKVKVTNLANGLTANLTINDRGPFTKGRILDVSQKSARDLGFLNQGVTRVRIEASETARSEC
jgi:rare lipoprotein A